jgi:hypothetical protein
MRRIISIVPAAFTTLLFVMSVTYGLGNLKLPVALFNTFNAQLAVFMIAMILTGYFIGQVNRRIRHELRGPYDIGLMVLTATLFSWLAIFVIHWFFMDETVPATAIEHRQFIGFCILASAIAVGITFAMLYRTIALRFVLSFLGVFLIGHMIVAVLYMEGRLL